MVAVFLFVVDLAICFDFYKIIFKEFVMVFMNSNITTSSHENGHCCVSLYSSSDLRISVLNGKELFLV